MIKLEIEGIKAIQDALNSLGPKLSNQILRSFNRKAGTRFIVKNLRGSLPYSKRSKRGIKITTSRRDPNRTHIYAGVTTQSFWLRWAELGTVDRNTRTGANRGSIRGRHRVGPIINSQIRPIIKYTEKELGKEISNILAKKLKRL